LSQLLSAEYIFVLFLLANYKLQCVISNSMVNEIIAPIYADDWPLDTYCKLISLMYVQLLQQFNNWKKSHLIHNYGWWKDNLQVLYTEIYAT